MDENRRSFLKRAGLTGLGLGCGFPVLEAAFGDSKEGSAATGASSSQWAMIVDIKKCLREEVRSACTEACHREHNVPDIPVPEEEVKWIWPEEYEHVFPDQAHPHTESAMKKAPVLVLCNHCTKPSCVRVCPTAATWKRKQDGVVMMDMHRCIGCRYCIAACPYGARSFNWRDPREYIEKDKDGRLPSDFPTRTKGVVEKCNFCAERLRSGRQPACVEAAGKVPGGEGALTFGDLAKPDSEVCQVLREKHTICRRVSLGTGPNVFYIV
ncbi:MAG: sulfate reduction electron transfer complex DsrMKJOP subunit DsrO [Planctomycetota bacterium]|jgi:molybdopterin-containing oxidoreductase family iron-sulfur binding subunit